MAGHSVGSKDDRKVEQTAVLKAYQTVEWMDRTWADSMVALSVDRWDCN